MDAQNNFIHWTTLPSAAITVHELMLITADALHPKRDTEVEQIGYGGCLMTLETEIKREVRNGAMSVRNPLTLGAHSFPHGAALWGAVVLPDEAHSVLACRGIGVRPTDPQVGPLDSVTADDTPKHDTRQAAITPKFSMTKAALIDSHEHEWPTIRRDMADAKTNGLAAAMAGARGWNESVALAWAKAKNKLKSVAKPADVLTQAMHSMVSLPGRKHTLQG